MKLLVVDDSEIFIERLLNRLNKSTNIEIVGWAYGENEALEKIESLTPDLVTLDIHMVEGNGVNALQTIKSKSPNTKVFMLTNFAFDQLKKQCIDSGADDFFDKSNDIERLIEKINSLETVNV